MEPNASFVQETGSIKPLPGVPTARKSNQQADNDYYFAGTYSTVITASSLVRGLRAHRAVVLANEGPPSAPSPPATTICAITSTFPTRFCPLTCSRSLSTRSICTPIGRTDPRYGIEVYFNGVLVQPADRHPPAATKVGLHHPAVHSGQCERAGRSRLR